MVLIKSVSETKLKECHFSGPIGRLSQLSNVCDSGQFDAAIFDETGVFIIRNVFEAATIEQYRKRFYQLYVKQGTRDKFNHVSMECEDPQLRSLAKNKKLITIMSKIFGESLALFNFRFVVKDENNYGAVFAHNDVCYHLGFLDRVSAFVPITPVNPRNGGMEYFLGTHKFGYMGDAGELNVDYLESGWPSIAPSVMPGDLIIMHSALWHRSGTNFSKEDRVIADIHFQPANDPSGSELVSGEWETEYRFPHHKTQEFFVRSRISRMIELENEVKALKSQISQLSVS